MRADGRAQDQIRPITVERGYVVYPEGSILISMGHTKVLCNASIEKRLPQWLNGRGQGWLTAEYAMLPRATHDRSMRDSRSARPNSRSLEISRLIGRSLRAVTDLTAIGEHTITIDCDVLQADGGTRTAAITGSYLALEMAIDHMLEEKKIERSPALARVSAISVGVVDGEVVVDLNYDEDHRAAVDLNIVMTDDKRFIEIQGTAEKTPFSSSQLEEMLAGARSGISAVFDATCRG
jgi:ribonuclease PH